MTTSPVTAAGAGLIRCEGCGLLCQPASALAAGHCPRCGDALVSRRYHSVETTWALVIAAAICYVPANVLPVLGTTTLGSTEYDTIMGGVIFLFTSGSWPLGLIVLIASVMVPLGKLIALGYLLLAVRHTLPRERGAMLRQRPAATLTARRQRTRLYHMVEFIGRWSMLDVFVDTFTVALVQLDPLMSVHPGPGVLFFAAVVVLTIIAADGFDSRLIWDAPDSVTAG